MGFKWVFKGLKSLTTTAVLISNSIIHIYYARF